MAKTYVDEIIGGDGKRRYNLVDSDGNVVIANVQIQKAYTPTQEGTAFGAEDIAALKDIDTSGSNANGNYIKFSDGTLIQWFRGEAVVGPAGGFTKIFPVPFIDNTYSCPPASLTARVVIFPDNVYAGSSNFWCYHMQGTSIIGTTVKFAYTAIGRWK